jgi:hypothetical protein
MAGARLNILVNEPNIAVRIDIDASDSLTTLWTRLLTLPNAPNYHIVDQYSIYKLTNSMLPRGKEKRLKFFKEFREEEAEALELTDVIGKFFTPTSINDEHVQIVMLYRPRK